MSLHPRPVDPVPVETAHIARAAFPGGNPYVRMRDELGPIFEDRDFAHLFPPRGQPAEAPWRLALVTIFQFAENLSDRQAADAVRGRIDWKYALSLPLTDPGFDHTILSEFRGRLLAGSSEQLLLEVLLEHCRRRGLLGARGRQRDPEGAPFTHVLAVVRSLNRVELVRETLRHALDVLASVVPEWLRPRALPAWVERYSRRSDEYRLPKGEEARRILAEEIGADGAALLSAIYAPEAPLWLREVRAVETLRRIWIQNFWPTEAGLRFRRPADGIPPAASFLSSPHDHDAHLSVKGTTCWIGYKVCLTETCDEETPHLITHIETTTAPIADGDVTPRIHHALHQKDLLPSVHLVDTGFLDAELLVESRRLYNVDLLGPTRRDHRWQARAADGFGAEHFTIDFTNRTAVCPAGHTSAEWVPRLDSRGNDSIYIRFSGSDCGPCPDRTKCTKSRAKHPRRSIAIRPQQQYEALRHRRDQETRPEFARAYAQRAGVEGTISQGVRRCGIRRTRYMGLGRTHLGHVLTATAINFTRVAEWLAGTPRAQTRCSAFATLMRQSP